MIILTIAIPSSTLTPAFAAEVSADITSGASSKTTDAYSPNLIEINVGDTVTWTNRDSQPHTVTSGTVGQPDGNFDSSPGFNPLLSPQGTFSHTFEEAGEFPYYCGLHPNMVGIVMVDVESIPNDVVTVKTDRSSYETGDVVTLSGKLTLTTDPIEQPLLIQVIDPEGNRDRVDQLETDEHGNYDYSFIAGAVMNTEGIYDVRVSYKTITAETTFEFIIGPIPDDGLFCGREVDDFDNVMLGTASSDSINGTGADDLIRGFGGDDIIDGKGGDDCIAGAGGDDTLRGGPGEDAVYGGEGNDVIYGNNGNDTLYGNAGKDLLSGGYGDDYVAGKSGNDVIYGNNGNDRLFGNDGDDYLKGGDGDDSMFGGEGNDELSGNAGEDRLSGQGGNDDIKGQRGDDRLNGGNGIDSLDGGRNGDKCFDSALSSTFANCEEEFVTFNEKITLDIAADEVTDTYDPGDSVAIEGTIDTLVDNEDVVIRFKEPSGSNAQTFNFGEPSSNGNFDAVFDIPNNADGGAWSVEVDYDDEQAYTYFLVEYDQDIVDTINLVLDETGGIYEAGAELTIYGQVDHDDAAEDNVNIKVFDPTDTEIQDENIDLDGEDFEFSFDLDNDAPHGRYAVKVTYDVDDQEGAILFEIESEGGNSNNDFTGDSETDGDLTAQIEMDNYEPGDSVLLEGTIDNYDSADNEELGIKVQDPDDVVVDYYGDSDATVQSDGDFDYAFDLDNDADEGVYTLVISYAADEVTLTFDVDL